MGRIPISVTLRKKVTLIGERDSDAVPMSMDYPPLKLHSSLALVWHAWQKQYNAMAPHFLQSLSVIQSASLLSLK